MGPEPRVIHGMPIPSDELFAKEERGEIVFGGCVIEIDQPSWKCSKCGAKFHKKTDELQNGVYEID